MKVKEFRKRHSLRKLLKEEQNELKELDQKLSKLYVRFNCCPINQKKWAKLFFEVQQLRKKIVTKQGHIKEIKDDL